MLWEQTAIIELDDTFLLKICFVSIYTHVSRSEDNFPKSVLFFHHVDPED